MKKSEILIKIYDAITGNRYQENALEFFREAEVSPNIDESDEASIRISYEGKDYFITLKEDNQE